jgi:hypothetical protein
MITAIYVKGNTKLTIVTQEDLYLEKMSDPKQPTPLNAGATTVPVSDGVFKVQSTQPIGVTSDTTQVHVAVSPYDKGGPLDPPKSMLPLNGSMPDLDHAALKAFLFSSKGMDSPK